METNTQKFAFILGREKQLCLAELKAVLYRLQFSFTVLSVYDNVAFINIENSDESGIARVMTALGGTVKIYKIFENLKATSQNDGMRLKDLLTAYIRHNPKEEGKFNFGISSYSRQFNQRSVNNMGLSMKKELKKEYSSRFVENREGKEVTSILSLKSKLVGKGYEFGLFESGEIGILVALSNAEEWSVRDYEKPRGDKRSGMLPPKLARIMINLAAADAQMVENKVDALLIDPFCGSGNVILEAMMLDMDSFGSDISEKAVDDTKENVEWLKEEKSIVSKVAVTQADATSAKYIELLSSNKLKLEDYGLTMVVGEPFLGEPKKFIPSLNAATGEYQKIQQIYLEFLKNFAEQEHGKTILCLVFPLVETVEGQKYSVFHKSVDEIKKLGYTVLQSPFIYGRDYQVVKREIALLTI
jgi:tRNA G10  N-methylase Trm11